GPAADRRFPTDDLPHERTDRGPDDPAAPAREPAHLRPLPARQSVRLALPGLRGRPGLRPPGLHRRWAGELQRQHGGSTVRGAAMRRAARLLAIAAACAASALAIAQSQEMPTEEAGEATAQSAEQDAPPGTDYVDLRRAKPITGN